jgi:hypothetical protein
MGQATSLVVQFTAFPQVVVLAMLVGVAPSHERPVKKRHARIDPETLV